MVFTYKFAGIAGAVALAYSSMTNYIKRPWLVSVPVLQNAEEQSSGVKLQQKLVFRVALFILGALPQIVKLFSIEGILLTRPIASLYFGSFLVLEIGVYFSRDGMGHRADVSRGSNPVLQGDNVQDGLGWKLRVGVVVFGNHIVLCPLGSLCIWDHKEYWSSSNRGSGPH